MKIDVTETTYVTKTIDVEFPLFLEDQYVIDDTVFTKATRIDADGVSRSVLKIERRSNDVEYQLHVRRLDLKTEALALIKSE